METIENMTVEQADSFIESSFNSQIARYVERYNVMEKEAYFYIGKMHVTIFETRSPNSIEIMPASKPVYRVRLIAWDDRGLNQRIRESVFDSIEESITYAKSYGNMTYKEFMQG